MEINVQPRALFIVARGLDSQEFVLQARDDYCIDSCAVPMMPIATPWLSGSLLLSSDIVICDAPIIHFALNSHQKRHI